MMNDIPVETDEPISEECQEVIKPKHKRRKVTIEDINEAHLEIINLEKEKLRHEIENALLIKRKLQLEIEALELGRAKFHES